MYRVSGLDLVCAEWLVVLEDTAGVNEAHAACWDVFVVFAAKLVLEVEDGGGLWESELVGAFGGGGLDFEADGACLAGRW